MASRFLSLFALIPVLRPMPLLRQRSPRPLPRQSRTRPPKASTTPPAPQTAAAPTPRRASFIRTGTTRAAQRHGRVRRRRLPPRPRRQSRSSRCARPGAGPGPDTDRSRRRHPPLARRPTPAQTASVRWNHSAGTPRRRGGPSPPGTRGHEPLPPPVVRDRRRAERPDRHYDRAMALPEVVGYPAVEDARYLDRELSWLDFNARVLALAEDASLPLLERAKFLAIFSSNLDEFFQVRVSGLKEQLAAGVRSDVARRPRPGRAAPRDPHPRRGARDPPGARVHEGGRARARRRPASSSPTGTISTTTSAPSSPASSKTRIFPVLTPLAVDPAHPFPYISNLSLNLAVVVRDPATGEQRFARVKVPPLLPRFVALPGQHALRPARAGDRRAPRHAVPRHGGARALPVPRHARRRLRADRRRRGPARRDGVRAAPAHEVRRRGAARGRPADDAATCSTCCAASSSSAPRTST